MKYKNSPQRSVIESLDGCGKTTAAEQAALELSEAYPASRISVVDSTGAYQYMDGALVSHKWPDLEKLKAGNDDSALTAARKLGAFTLARRHAEAQASRDADLLIGVRDPFRIDPTVYSLIFGPKQVANLSITARLRIFSSLTTFPHPEAIAHLRADPQEAQANISRRSMQDRHESMEDLELVAEELPLVLEGYKRLYGTRIFDIDALRPHTGDELTASLEPLLAPARVSIAIPDVPAAVLR